MCRNPSLTLQTGLGNVEVKCLDSALEWPLARFVFFI